MTNMESILLILTAFLPPIIYAIWIRNTERFHREKWFPIFLCFLWGATIAVIAAIILEMLLQIPIAYSSNGNFYTIAFLMAVIIAPFAEELTKPLALRLKRVKKELDELEDGLIYGAVAGLGFSATENLLYGWSFLSQGRSLSSPFSLFLVAFLIFMALRSFGGCLLHASATAWTGYGMGKRVIKKTSAVKILPFFVLAFGIHGFYNFLLSYDMMGATIGLFAALTFAYITIKIVRDKIRSLDYTSI